MRGGLQFCSVKSESPPNQGDSEGREQRLRVPRRREADIILKDESFDVPEAEVASEDEEEEDVVEPAEVPPLPDGFDVADAEEAPADGEMPARAEVPSGSFRFAV